MYKLINSLINFNIINNKQINKSTFFSLNFNRFFIILHKWVKQKDIWNHKNFTILIGSKE